MEALLDAGADVNQGADGCVALRAAAAHGHDAMVHLLIDRGASTDSPLPERTALQDAAQSWLHKMPALISIVRMTGLFHAQARIESKYHMPAPRHSARE